MGRGPVGPDPRIIVPAIQQASKKRPGLPSISDEEAERRRRAADAARRRRARLQRLLVVASLAAFLAWFVLDLVVSRS